MKLLILQMQLIFIYYKCIHQIHHNHERSDNLMSDFCDGELYRKHSLFSVDRQALQVLLYNDDIEICNPLGSRAKVHKMCKYINSFALLL